jgi:hypothetical protein
MFWLGRCSDKGHLDNCFDLVEPWEAFNWNEVERPATAQTQPENIRTGPPYDDPAFESVCREHGIWGTAASAMAAVFWRAKGEQQEASPIGRLYRNADESIRFEAEGDPFIRDGMLVFEQQEGGDAQPTCRISHAQHFTPFFLLANMRRICEPSLRRNANWVLAMQLFALGSTSARKVCRDAGIDPDGLEVRPAAMTGGNRG